MQTRWRIAELAEVVGRVLAGTEHAEQPSGRVRDVPDLRTIRYYTTLGLVDRPLEMQGRTAYYGWRHAWQLLAIKHLQANGLSLVEVQERLAGADDRTLKKMAKLPDRLVRSKAAGMAAEEPATPPAQRATFWADAPVAAAIDRGGEGIVEMRHVTHAVHIKLDDGATLVLEGVEPGVLTHDKLAAIELVARGLVTQLRLFGIAGQPSSAASELARQPPLSNSNTKRAERSRS